jgi:hypothetical protein
LFENIFVNDEIYKPADYTKKEIEEFLENLDVKTFESINVFLTNAPKIEHTLTYTNSLGNERKIVLSSLNDFFTLR